MYPRIPCDLCSFCGIGNITPMLKDHNHDLVKQLSEDSSSLYRYEAYLKNSIGCDHCQTLWRRMQELDEEKVRLLTAEIQRHVEAGTFS